MISSALDDTPLNMEQSREVFECVATSVSRVVVYVSIALPAYSNDISVFSQTIHLKPRWALGLSTLHRLRGLARQFHLIQYTSLLAKFPWLWRAGSADTALKMEQLCEAF